MKRKKFTWYSKRFDSDGDNVPNFRDCQPFNPFRQHISSTQKERVDALDIWLNVERGGEDDDFVKIGKESKQDAPLATQQVYSLFSKYPNLLGKAERLSEEGRFTISHTSDPSGKSLDLEGAYGTQITGQVRTKGVYESALPEQNRQTLAKVMFHEMKHEDQERRDPEKFPKKYRNIKRKFYVGKRTASRYFMNPYEAEAQRYGARKEKEPHLVDEDAEEKVKKFFDIIE